MFTRFVVILLLFITGSTMSFAQCTDFVNQNCLDKFEEFVYDGNVSLTELKEGDTAELFKTFFSGQTYRMVICKSDKLPPIRIKVVNAEGVILFDNKDHNYQEIWDFAVKGTQKMIVQLEVLEDKSVSTSDNTECVAILFGIDKEKK